MQQFSSATGNFHLVHPGTGTTRKTAVTLQLSAQLGTDRVQNLSNILH